MVEEAPLEEVGTGLAPVRPGVTQVLFQTSAPRLHDRSRLPTQLERSRPFLEANEWVSALTSKSKEVPMSTYSPDPERERPEPAPGQPGTMPEQEPGVTAPEPDTLPEEPDVTPPEPESVRL